MAAAAVRRYSDTYPRTDFPLIKRQRRRVRGRSFIVTYSPASFLLPCHYLTPARTQRAFGGVVCEKVGLRLRDAAARVQALCARSHALPG